MKSKRLEIYLGRTCNKKCIYCNEYSVLLDNWSKKISEKDILKKLIKYKGSGYNHVTFLGGEPFIQSNFLFGLQVAKKLGYKILVTTNATTLGIEKQAKKYLPYIDELILSINTIDEISYKKIHQVTNFLNYDLVFENIEKYWKGNLLKVNCVLNKYNLDDIDNIISFVSKKGVTEISLTYPDLHYKFYSKEYAKSKILTKYDTLKKYIELYFKVAKKHGLELKIVDIPFCILEKTEYIKNTEEYAYSNRLKVDEDEIELDRDKISPRNRKQIPKCEKCKYKNICWGPGVEYIKMFGDSEINPIKYEC